MRVVMIGATGRHAHWALDEMSRRSVRVCALVRNRERAERALHSGAVETVIADLTRPETLPEAVADMDGLFRIGPAHARGRPKWV